MARPYDDAGSSERAAGGRGLMVVLLGCALFFQRADVVIFSMTSEAIRTEFGLSDVQMGLLNGSAMALLYAFAALPLARIADRGYRRNVIVASLALWSLFTAVTGLATGFASVFAIRLLIGIGEAGAGPAAFSLIAARFAPSERAGAMSVMQAGGYLGMVAGLWGAGIAIARLGWRHTFLIFGAPGLLLALLILLAVREPRDVTPGEAAPIGAVLGALRNRMILHLFALLASATMISYGVFVWSPAFYMRSYGMSAGDVGLWLGIAIGAGTLLGTLLGGFLSNRIAPRYPNGGLVLSFWALAINLPLNVGAFLATEKLVSLSLLLACSIVGAVCVAPVYATLQTVVPAKFRATALAIVASGVALAGQGLGPVAVGVISDAAKAAAGAESLRWSLIIATAAGIWPVYHGWRVMRLAPAELARAAREDIS